MKLPTAQDLMFRKGASEHENIILSGFVIQNTGALEDGSLADIEIYPVYLLKHLHVTFSFTWSKDSFWCNCYGWERKKEQISAVFNRIRVKMHSFFCMFQILAKDLDVNFHEPSSEIIKPI